MCVCVCVFVVLFYRCALNGKNVFIILDVVKYAIFSHMQPCFGPLPFPFFLRRVWAYSFYPFVVIRCTFNIIVISLIFQHNIDSMVPHTHRDTQTYRYTNSFTSFSLHAMLPISSSRYHYHYHRHHKTSRRTKREKTCPIRLKKRFHNRWMGGWLDIRCVCVFVWINRNCITEVNSPIKSLAEY